MVSRRRRHSSTLLEVYFREVSRTPLLTPEEEAALGRRVQNAVGSHTVDEEACRLLVRSNLRLVVVLAKRFTGRGLDLADLIQEGAFGLIRAAKDFDPDRGRFSTHASSWIKQYITKAVSGKVRTVRVPNYAQRLTSIYESVEKELRRDAEACPTQTAVLARTKEVAAERGYARPRDETLLAGVEALRRNTLSLDAERSRGAERLTNLIVDQSTVADPHGDDWQELGRKALKNLDVLDGREREVICSYYGLEGRVPENLSAIGRRLGRTRERVRQLKERALAKLRKSLQESNSNG